MENIYLKKEYKDKLDNLRNIINLLEKTFNANNDGSDKPLSVLLQGYERLEYYLVKFLVEDISQLTGNSLFSSGFHSVEVYNEICTYLGENDWLEGLVTETERKIKTGEIK